jgi:hypothetical protein
MFGIIPPKPKTVDSVLATFQQAAADLKDIASRADVLVASHNEEILSLQEQINAKQGDIADELNEKSRALKAAKNIEALIGL